MDFPAVMSGEEPSRRLVLIHPVKLIIAAVVPTLLIGYEINFTFSLFNANTWAEKEPPRRRATGWTVARSPVSIEDMEPFFQPPPRLTVETFHTIYSYIVSQSVLGADTLVGGGVSFRK